MNFEEDPLDLVDPWLDPADGELWAFIVAGLSYGRVEQIKASAIRLLRGWEKEGVGVHGQGLRNAILQGLRAPRHWKHRLNTESDLNEALSMLSGALSQHQSLASLYASCEQNSAEDHLQAFVDALRTFLPKRRHRTRSGTGGTWFCSSPRDGSTCKRFLMWLRWMVRKDHRDPGFWQNPKLYRAGQALPQASKLFSPVDTHIFQWARAQGILRTQSPTWKSVLKITEEFRKRDPQDPLRWDFELSHEGMSQKRRVSLA